jgi:AraC-like DNA-binding protein
VVAGAAPAFDKESWLLIPAGHRLTFVNQPEQGKFRSRAHPADPAPAEWLAAAQAGSSASRAIRVSPALAFCFELVTTMADRQLCETAQTQLLQGFMPSCREAGARPALSRHTMTLGERLARYLGVEPGADHTAGGVAPHFAMSRASMARKLAAEGRSFRQLLTQVRMSHALTLLQQGWRRWRRPSPVATTPSRFAARFKQEFGLTPYQYLRTCPSSLSLTAARQVNSY